MPARPWKDRSRHSDSSLRARLRYLRKSNDELRGEVSRLNRENSELRKKLGMLRELVNGDASELSTGSPQT